MSIGKATAVVLIPAGVMALLSIIIFTLKSRRSEEQVMVAVRGHLRLAPLMVVLMLILVGCGVVFGS